jgi:hypothetical protein
MAILLFIGALGVGVAGVGHSDCAADDVACSCSCHDTVALHAQSDFLVFQCVVEMIAGEPRSHLCLIPPDIFRPPAV